MLIRYLLSHALSLLGNSIAAIALPWLVLVRTGDPAAAGLIAAVSALPMLVAAVAGGLVIDRFGRRRTSIWADFASALAVAAVPFVDEVSGLTVAWFMVLGVAGALLDVPGMTAREALAPDVAAAAGVGLERLAGLREGVSGVVLVVGPAAAGGLLVLLDPTTVLWITAVCSAAAALTTATLPARLGRGSGEAGGGVRTELLKGFRVLGGDRVLAAMTLVVTISVLVLAPLQNILLPVYLVARDSPGGFGLVIAFLAVGGIGGSIVYSIAGARLSRRAVFVAAQVVTAFGTVGLALLPPLPVLLAVAALAGFGAGPMQALALVLVTERIPERYRGRVLGLQNAATMTAVPVGTLVAGLLISGIGLRETGVLLAVAWGVVAAFALLVPALRRLEPPAGGQRADEAPVGEREPTAETASAAE
ncbi:MFS transporter [Micromonospora rubida]|uniref:MFS transporter n=1 Tax=Micromonospora rubida TaxID=2697657 RepID=UPI0013765F1E|nr:MFS transporter [Micromonospora rubida]NBE80067.1 MFS transporter [Micromonospora rubida]